MNRLAHSFKAFIRASQMSRHEVFVFIEGDKVDPYFYDEIVRRVCISTGKTYWLGRSYEIDTQRSGKDILVAYFKYLRTRRSLIDSFKGKKTLSVFYLDKDIDDLLRKKINSTHIIYTKNYDAESHVFTDADLTKAIATAASLTIQEANQLLGNDPNRWRIEITNIWKDWIKLCIFIAKKKINHGTNYRVASKINNPLTSPTNQALYNQQLRSIKNRTNLTNIQFDRSYNRISNLVDHVYGLGEQDTIFKGKWYSTLIEEVLRSNLQNRNLNGLGDRVLSTSLQTLNFDSPWTDHFKNPLRNLIQLL